MNVVIDAMQPTPASRTLWWCSLAGVLAGGFLMRLITIDRNTPGLGTFVYFGLLAVMSLVIAIPGATSGAFIWHQSSRRSWLAPLRKLGDDTRARWVVILLVALATLVFVSAGRRLPPWHVWMSAFCFNVLIAWRVFPFVLCELRAAQQKRCEVAHVQ